MAGDDGKRVKKKKKKKKKKKLLFWFGIFMFISLFCCTFILTCLSHGGGGRNPCEE